MKISQSTFSEMCSKQPFHRLGKLGVKVRKAKRILGLKVNEDGNSLDMLVTVCGVSGRTLSMGFQSFRFG